MALRRKKQLEAAEEFHNLYSSPNTIRISKSSRTKRAEHTACIGETQNAYSIGGFNHRAFHVGFLVNKAALEQLIFGAHVPVTVRRL